VQSQATDDYFHLNEFSLRAPGFFLLDYFYGIISFGTFRDLR